MKFIQYSGSTIYLLDISMTRRETVIFAHNLKKFALHSSIMLWFFAVAKN